jgi:hypothetical protein
MKKQVLHAAIVLAILGFSASAFAQRTDAKEKDLMGNVKSMGINSYNFSQCFGETSKGSLKDHSEYSFDKLGNFTDMSENDINHTYNNLYQKSKLISQDILNSDGTLYKRIKYSYTPTGYIQTTYKSDGRELSKKVRKGNIITMTGEANSTSYLNAKGKEYKMEATVSGLMDVTSSTKYNTNGNPISFSMQLSSGGYVRNRIITYKSYKYDDHNNWIYREKFQDGSPEIIEERNITYYSTK